MGSLFMKDVRKKNIEDFIPKIQGKKNSGGRGEMAG